MQARCAAPACCCSPCGAAAAAPPPCAGRRGLVRGRGALLAAAPRLRAGRARAAARARVLVAGADAVGAEVAKDLALLGVAAVDVFDGDGDGDGGGGGGAHLYGARPEATRLARTVAGAAGRLSETRVSAADALEVGAYDCVAACGSGREAACALSDACRAAGVPFVWCRCAGAAFCVFDDFGDGAAVASRELAGAARESVPLEPLRALGDNLYRAEAAGRQRHEACEGDFLDLDGGAVLEVRAVATPWALEAALIEGAVDTKKRCGARLRPATRILKQVSLRDALAAASFGSCDGARLDRRALDAIIGSDDAPDAAAAAAAAGVAAHDVLKAVSGGLLGGPAPGQILAHRPAAPVPDIPEAARVLVVGAGATGCELLKNLGLLGVARVTVCDDDAVAPSNLSRQFLFRPNDVGASKAERAARAAARLAPDTEYVAIPRRLDAASVDAVAWDQVDVVVSAVDSLAARAFLSRVCVERGLPFVDCGTLGAAASVQPALPHATESWHATAVADDGDDRGGVPVCTIKDHPYKAEHCVWWARDAFAGRFEARPERLAAALRAARAPGGARRWCRKNPDAAAAAADDAEGLLAGDADAWARAAFRELFVEPVARLLAAHPLDEVDEDGAAYWTGTRVPPAAPAREDAAFLAATAALRRRALGGGGAAAAAAPAPRARDAAARLEAAVARLGPDAAVAPLAFDKDDAEHATWLALAANLRGAAFGVPPVDRLRAAQIAGAVVPAVATATAVASGLCALEAAKLLGGGATRARLRSTFCGLAAPLWGQAPPARPARWRLPGGAVASEWAPPTIRCAPADSVRAVAGRVAALLCPDEEIETLVAPNGDLVFARALHARHAPALGDVLEGASVVEVQATSGDLELPAVRLVVAGD